MAQPVVLSKVHTYAADLEAARGKHTSPSTVSGSQLSGQPTLSPTNQSRSTVSTTQKPPTLAIPTAPIKLTASAPRDASYSATIITDQRRNKFNLTAEMTAAISDWWQDKLKSIKKEKKPRYTVPKATHRKGIISEATSQTGRAATSDYKTVVANHGNSSMASVPPKPPASPSAATIPVPLSTWETAHTVSLNVDSDKRATPVVSLGELAHPDTLTPEKSTFPMSTIRNVVVTEKTIPSLSAALAYEDDGELVSDTTVNPIIPRIEPIIPKVETADPVPVITPYEFKKIEPEAPRITPNSPVHTVVSALTEPLAPTIPANLTSVRGEVAERRETLRQEQIERGVSTAQRSTLSRIAPYIAGLGFILTAGGVITYIVFQNTLSSVPAVISDTTTNNVYPVNLDFDETGSPLTSRVNVALDAPNRLSLYRAVSEAAGPNDGYFVVTPLDYATNLPLTVEDILLLINRGFQPAFINNVTTITLGTYTEDPVIVLTTTSQNDMRGQLFAWEETMSQDLSPWFGVPLLKTSVTSLTNFTDSQQADTDVRVLKDDIGNTRILYGFVDQNTVIITTSGTAFENVLRTYRNY